MMTVPTVSIITPTYRRDRCLQAVYRTVARQTLADFEWLILDDSPEPSRFFSELNDPRIRYMHTAGPKISIGAKRNRLVEQARGQVIAHFDDDDYYAPNYLEAMLGYMRRGADVVKLTGWFLYSFVHETFGYWDLEQKLGVQFVWSPDPIKAVDMSGEVDSPAWENLRLGFGFSCVYKKPVWDKCRFTDRNFDEDAIFIRSALSYDANVYLVKDYYGLALHTLHDNNASICLPQYNLPMFSMEKFFRSDVLEFLDMVRPESSQRYPYPRHCV